jgi:hypothetical protein|tara:strand:+ start:4663 stop:4914 length:252 start_codon:yes stop_codon:yes gene_type:complete
MPIFKGKDPVIKLGDKVIDFVARCNRPGRRVCVREEYQEIETPPYYIDNGVAIELPGPMQLLKVWTFHYSDGTTEQLSQTGAL